jgi:hypothetical protein
VMAIHWMRRKRGVFACMVVSSDALLSLLDGMCD